MKKVFATAAFFMLTLLFVQSYAQSANEITERSSFMDRVYTGGGLGMSFGSGISYVQLSPLVGYRVTNEFSAGTAISYRYTKYKVLDVSTNDYGINPFARYNVYDPFFLQAEIEYLNYERVRFDKTTFRDNFTSFLIGGGISQPLGGKAFFNVTVLYNLSYVPSDLTDPYDSPLVVRAGISLGF